ncbi:ATP-binding protein [Cysteiniphilum marinum]|uniref:ATP-binding protein n=1 Tax=Cysteiniphilum marinum TaxID=2774191 RepID=UPI00193AAB17|nr:ATP-binding protein [Cysteiniphilum marinum]
MINFFKDSTRNLKAFFGKDVTLLDSTKMQCAIYGADDEHEAILCDDGELSTMIEVLGHGSPLTIDEISSNASYLADALNGFFKSKDKRLIASYYNNPEDNDFANEMSALFDENCDTLGLNIKDIHREELKKLASLTTTNRFMLTIETGKGSINKLDYDRYESEKAPVVDEYFQALGLKDRFNSKKLVKQYGQNPLHLNAGVFHQHQDTVNGVLNALNATQIKYKVMPAKYAVRFMKRVFDAFTPLNWQPITTPQTEAEIEADYLRFMRIADSSPVAPAHDDMSNRLLPPLVTQIIGDDALIYEDGMVSFNGQTFKAMYVEIPQKQLAMFADFIKTVKDIPFLMSWYLEANDSKINFHISMGTLVGMFGFLPFGQSAKDVKKAADILKFYRKESGKPMAMYRLCFLTWAETDEDNKSCLRRANRLRSLIAQWGSEQIVKSEKYDPVQAIIETVPVMAKPTIARATPCVVEEALLQMPFDKVSSPWTVGSSYFISAIDQSIYPVYLGRGQQNYPRVVHVGSTGEGKSLTKNSMLLNTLFKDSYHQLPVLAMCTIGYDAALFAKTIQQALPEDKRHLVIYDKPKLTADYCVNIFDTEYGARQAKTEQINIIAGFLGQCCAEKDEVSVSENFESILKDSISFAYHYYDDNSDFAKELTTGADKEIDAYFKSQAIDRNKLRQWTWWQAFDYFHDLGNTRLAYRCQLQAMPCIGDLVHVMSEKQSLLEDAKEIIENYSRLFDVFKRRMITLQESFPNLTGITRYNPESARVIALDLESVCPKGSLPDQPESPQDRQSAIMYQLYFMFLTRKFSIPLSRSEFLSDTKVDEKYHDYHFKIIENEKGLPKIFDVDEFHRASKAHGFQTNIDRIIREMRKYGAEVSGASQQINDWSPTLISNIPNIFIFSMDARAEVQRQYFKDYLGFSEADFELARKHLVGLHHQYGQPFLLYIKKVDGSKKSMLVPLYHSASATKLWALTTDDKCHAFRTTLEEKLAQAKVHNPVLMAREVLVEKFPSGKIDSAVESRQLQYPNKSVQAITQELLNECLQIVLEEKINA